MAKASACTGAQLPRAMPLSARLFLGGGEGSAPRLQWSPGCERVGGGAGNCGRFPESISASPVTFLNSAEVEVRRELVGLANEVAVSSKVCASGSHWEGGSRPLDPPLCTGQPPRAGTEGAGHRTPGGPPHLGLRVVEATDSPVCSQA